METELAAAGKKKRRSKADLHTDAKKSLENKKQQLQKSHKREEGLRSALADSEGLVARMLEALCEAEEAAEAANTRLSQRLMELEPFGDEALRGKAIFRRKQLMEEVKRLQEDAKAPEAQHEKALNAVKATLLQIQDDFFLFSFAVKKYLVLTHLGEELSVPELLKRGAKVAWNPALGQVAATEGRADRSAVSFATLMTDVILSLQNARFVLALGTSKEKEDAMKKRFGELSLMSPYDAAKGLMKLLKEFPVTFHLQSNHDLYVHCCAMDEKLLGMMKGNKGFWVSSLETVRKSDLTALTWIFDDQMAAHDILIQNEGLWQPVPPGVTRHSLEGGAATGTAQVAMIRVAKSSR